MKQLMIILVTLVLISGCQEQQKTPQELQDDYTASQMQKIEQWSGKTAQRIAVLERWTVGANARMDAINNNTLLLRANLPDPNDLIRIDRELLELSVENGIILQHITDMDSSENDILNSILDTQEIMSNRMDGLQDAYISHEHITLAMPFKTDKSKPISCDDGSQNLPTSFKE